MFAALAATAGPASVLAEDPFPSRRIRVISPYAAGGVVEAAARTFTDFMAEELGQPVVIEAMPGAGGAIGTQHVARSSPDGYTCVLASVGHVANPQLQAASYHPVTDFQAASMIGYTSTIAVVPSSSQMRSLQDVVSAARASPGTLHYMSGGNGGFAHLATELFKHSTGIDLVGVTYKGLPPGMQDLVAGRLDFGLVSSSVALPLIQAGRLRAVGVMAPDREKDLPDVMTFDEQKFSSSVLSSWFILTFPAKTPASVIKQVNACINKALTSDEVKRRMRAAHITPAEPASPGYAQAMLSADYLKIGQLIKEAGIKAG